MPIATINPATGETLRTFSELDEQSLAEKLQHAADTFRTYKVTSLQDRAARMQRVANLLEN
jgi:succinate-semialdehyde dehydrogenase/glutarate-semialdehyde dehydrogenase